MRYLASLLLLQQGPSMTPLSVDPQRVERELAADADVLRSLRENGDGSNVLRPVDVRFVGAVADVTALETEIGAMGWRVLQRVSLDDGSEALDVQRDQSTDTAAIRRLTETALEIEGRYRVRYDGWGTVATKR